MCYTLVVRGVFSMYDSIRNTKELIANQIEKGFEFVDGKPFSEYQKVYFSTNENIKGYLNIENIKDKENALSVLASGDHSFNLIAEGILDIDTFDTNKLTEYYVFGLKKALILKYNYKEYLNIISLLINENTSFYIINDILYDLLSYMDIKYREFWKNILDYNYKEQKNSNIKLNLIKMLFINIKDGSNFNNYIENEEKYLKLKNNINKVNITFKCANAKNLYDEFNRKYNLILLSNILDYFGVNWNINDYTNKLNKICNDNYIIFLKYIYLYYTDNFTRTKSLITGIKSDREDLKDYIIEKLPYYYNKYGDGIILSKNKI